MFKITNVKVQKSTGENVFFSQIINCLSYRPGGKMQAAGFARQGTVLTRGVDGFTGTRQCHELRGKP